MDPYDPPLDTARHLRYWQRCLRTLLPHHYTSMDSTRLSLAFFVLASIDLLSPRTTAPPAKPVLTPADRRRLRRWVLSCQHPDGGFCGSPTHVFPRATQTADHDSENAHIGGTYFALLLLAILAPDDDDAGAAGAFAGVDRVRTLRWLRRLQRPEDGSFGEAVYDPPVIPHADKDTKDTPIVAGGRDMRYCYLAAAVRWMLRGNRDPSDDEYVPDIDVSALVAHIHRGQTYDGGFAESWQHESHAGYAYCAVAALAMLDRPLDGGEQPLSSPQQQNLQNGIGNRQALVSFLMSRQFAYLPGSSSADEQEDQDDDPETANFRLPDLSHDEPAQFIGFNGRCNKIADTCYTWWTQGTLAVLGLVENPAADDDDNNNNKQKTTTTATTTTAMPSNPTALKAQRAFLLEQTQHMIGGFGKNPGSPPDVGHGCLGLAALATMGDPSLKRLDPALCVSVDTVAKIVRARNGLLRRRAADKKGQDQDGHVFADRLVAMAVSMRGGGGGGGGHVLDGLVVAAAVS